MFPIPGQTPEPPDPRVIAKRKHKVRAQLNAKWRELMPHLARIEECAQRGPTSMGEAALTHSALALVAAEIRFRQQEDLELRLFMDPSNTLDENPEDQDGDEPES